MIILTPMKEEYEIAQERFGLNHKIILLGVGPRNALNTLLELKLPRYADNIMLFGYAGSKTLPVGTEVFVTESYIHQHYGANYEDPPCRLIRPKIEGVPELGVPCYSSSDFVTESDIKESAIFDMELGFVTILHPRVTCWRRVSDGLKLDEFYETIRKEK